MKTMKTVEPGVASAAATPRSMPEKLPEMPPPEAVDVPDGTEDDAGSP